jgi:propanol-preferring alcohol dehydrogenase
MKALRFTAGQRPELIEVDVPAPGPGEVLVKVGGAGACHSDLHIMEAPALPWPTFTLGHETAGWVAEIGAGVMSLREGDPVAVHSAWGCGRCSNCRAGTVNYCDDNSNAVVRRMMSGQLTPPVQIPPAANGIGADGGMAEFVLVPSASSLVPLGDLDSGRRGAAHGRRTHSVPRGETVAAAPRARQHGRRDRRRRSRTHGDPDPARVVRVAHHRD